MVSLSDLPAEILERERTPVAAGVPRTTAEMLAIECFERMTHGHETFWTVVYEPFMLRDLTRETVRAVVRMGLEQTKGTYRLVGRLFNLPPSDYKRFLGFLQKYECHMPFQHFRVLGAPLDRMPVGASEPKENRSVGKPMPQRIGA